MDVSKVMQFAQEMMRRQVAMKSKILEPICARYRALDLTQERVVLELTYDEASDLRDGWLPTLAYALSEIPVPTERARTVVVRGPGMADWPIEFSPFD